MIRPAILLSAILLSGCAADQERPVRTVTVRVPVQVECIPASLGEAPAYPDTDDALIGASDAAERYRLIAAGRKLRAARLGEIEPVIQICRQKGAAK